MVANAIQKTVVIDREASFGDVTAKNWDALTANGYIIYVHDLNDDEVKQASVENTNHRIRAADPHAPIPALRNSSVSWGWWWHGGVVNANEAAQATRIAQDEMLSGALGGEQLGYSAGIAGGTAAIPTVDAAHGNNLTPYSFGFFYDTSAAQGFFRQWASVTEGGGSPDTLVLSAGHTIPFTPDGGGADRIYATIEHYPDWDALEDHAHASHRSHTALWKGRQSDDNVEVKGMKFGVEFGPIEAGMPAELQFTNGVLTFAHEGITQPALTASPNGIPGRAVGRGVTTLMHWAAVDALLAAQNFWGQVKITCGIKPELVAGPNGQEGGHGFGVTEDSFGATMLEVTVPFLDDYAVEWRADTRRHLLLQIGTATTDSRFIYFPNLQYVEEPGRVSVGGRRGSLLKFRAAERQVAQGALTAAQYHRARAKFVMGRVG